MPDDFVVFLIGMRVNRPWMIRKWVPVATAMPRMLRVRAGDYECTYGNMPRVGLASAGTHVPVGSTGQSAARRIGAADVDEPALAPYQNP